ncbi:DNA-binding protein [Methylobacterium fujisawaense]
MASTRSFDETKRARAMSDPAFHDALLTEAVHQFLDNGVSTGKLLLSDYVEAAIGFERLARVHGIATERLRHVLEPDVDTDAGELLGILATIQKTAGLRLIVGIGR